ncbi:MAG: TlpA family protein disulfide reductase [Nocardioides sp.]
MIGLVAWLVASGSDGGDPRARSADGSVVEEFEPDDRIEGEPFQARMLSGDRFDSGDLAGQVAVYNVWGSWCVPCVTEAPELVEVAEEFTGQVQFVGINVRDNDAAARAFERDHDVPYDSVVSSDSSQAILAFQGALAAAAVPTTLVVDAEGRVAARAVGPVTASTLRALIEPVLAETDAQD